MERKALGKGLSSLIPSGSRQEESPQDQRLKEVALEDIVPNPNQPRKLFAKEALDELASSIEEKGILQPLIVRHLGGGKYELIAGERRLRAAQQAGLTSVPVFIKEIKDDELLELALIENIQREDLNPIEEALAYRDLLSKFQYTQDELARRLGKDRSSIANALRLLKLPDEIRDYVIDGSLSMGHARALLAVEDKDQQIQIAKDIIENQLSVREIENLIKRLREEEFEAPSAAKKEFSTEKAFNTALSRAEKNLSDHLKTRVKIQGSSDQGKLTIFYHSKDQLNDLIDKLQ